MLVFDWFALALALAGQPAYKHVPRFASKVNDDRPVIGLRAQAFFRFVAFALSANATVLAMRVYEPLRSNYLRTTWYLFSFLYAESVTRKVDAYTHFVSRKEESFFVRPTRKKLMD